MVVCRSCVGVWQNDRVEIIANDMGNRTTPSYVAYTDSERLIGDAAKNQVRRLVCLVTRLERMRITSKANYMLPSPTATHHITHGPCGCRSP